jgi:hypothetical protein
LRPVRSRAAILALSLAALAVAGCGGPKDETPVACLEGPGAYSHALTGAPGAVKLDGGTLISECLAENQKGGDLANVGTALVTVATKLNSEARADPGDAANLQLGYLLGAAQRGAESTEGIHTDLIRRLSVAARYSPDNRPLPAIFLRTYRQGYDAGHAAG